MLEPHAKLVFGTSSIALPEHLQDGTAETLLQTAYAAGIRQFDTSALYGGGVSEEGLGNFLKSHSFSDVKVTTKCGCYRAYGARPANQGGTTDRRDYSAEATRASVAQSNERLGDGRLDTVFIHDADMHMSDALDGAYRALMDLKAEGVIRRVGVASNHVYTIQAMLERAPFDAIMLANSYSVLDPLSAKPLLDSTQKDDVKAHIAGPYLSGILATGLSGTRSYRYATAPEDLQSAVGLLELLCEAWDIPLRHCALAYLIADKNTAKLVFGASNPKQVADSIHLATTPVPAEFLKAIEALQTTIEPILHKADRCAPA